VRSLPTEFSLRRATFAWWVVFGLKMSLMRRATVGLHFPCHFRTVARPSAGSGQSSLAPILFLGPFPLISLVSFPTPFLPRFSDRHYFGAFCGDLIFLCRLQFSVR
jgi:hypothetical protein